MKGIIRQGTLSIVFGLALTSIASAGVIPNGGSFSDTIDFDGDVDTHTFQGNAGDMGLFSVSGTVESGRSSKSATRTGRFLPEMTSSKV